ncbi:MAG: nuclear transport factor 2 family protein [Parasphingorhabdus sp.]
MSSDSKPAALLSEVYRLAGERDWDAVEARVHPDFILYEAESLPFGGEWRGKDALQRCAAAMYATWEEASVNINEITGGEEWAVVVLSLTMKSKKTGRTFTQTVNEAARFDDGLLKELRIHYFDAAEVTAEAGEAA